jgi:folylpolyglutamate synthase/dihydropteroate synthase
MTPDNPRALSAEAWAEVLALRGVETHPTGSIGEAVAAATEAARDANVPVVCLGSLYTYGDVVAAIKKK